VKKVLLLRLLWPLVVLLPGAGCVSLGGFMYRHHMEGLADDLKVEARTIDVGGVPVAAYVREGHDPVLMLHGFTSNKEGWLNVARGIGDRGLVIPDLLGHGRTPPTPEPMTAVRQADVVAGLLDALGLTRVHVTGMSMGGHIAGELALRRPDLVRSVTFIDAVGWQGAEPSQFDRALARGDASFDTPTPEAVDAFWNWLVVSPPPDLPGPILAYLREDRVARNRTVLQIFEDYEPTRFSLEGRLGEIAAPVNAIWCPADRMADITAADELAVETGAKVTRLEGCGHLPHLEQPEATGAALAAILTRVEQR
jgi:2-hydroxy-6-oxonona-2,4-dienedioate hydrolase